MDDCGNTATCSQEFVIDDIELSVGVYLEGSAINPNGTQTYVLPMRNRLNTLKVLPGQCYFSFFTGNVYSPPGQPYNIPPWNYNGNEGDGFDSGGNPTPGTANYPPDIVDWVLVSLRESPTSPPVCMKAALLDNSGNVEFVDGGFTCCELSHDASYYVVIEHRSHLIVMSNEPVQVINGTISYDFRIQPGYFDDQGFGGVSQKELLPNYPGKYAMYAGNGKKEPGFNDNVGINLNDRTFWEGENGNSGKYLNGDYNMTGDCNFYDRITFENNNGLSTTVPAN